MYLRAEPEDYIAINSPLPEGGSPRARAINLSTPKGEGYTDYIPESAV